MFKNKNKAITLIELLVALGIMGLTTALGAMFLKFQQPGLQLSAAANSIRSALLAARGRTLAEQIVYGVYFDVNNDQFELQRLAAPPTVVQGETLPGLVKFYSAGQFSNNTAAFNTAGAPARSGSIILQNSDGAKKTIIISPSGFIKVQ